MSIIKIHLYRYQAPKQQKYLLTYIPEIHSTIGCFVEFAINALNIQDCHRDQLLVENDGYVIPQCLDCRILEKMSQLTLKVIKKYEEKRKASPMTGMWIGQKIDEKQLQQQRLQQTENIRQMMEEQSENSESTPKFSEDGFAKNKKQVTVQKLPKKKPSSQLNEKPQKKSSKNIKEKKASIVESESSQSQKQVKKPKLKKPQLAKGKKVQSFKKQSSSQSEVQQQESGNVSQSQSSQSSEEQLPRVIRTKKAQIKEKIHEKEMQKIQKHKKTQNKVQQKISKQTVNLPKPLAQKFTKATQRQPQVERIQPQKNGNKKEIAKNYPVNYAQKKKLIQIDDIESSDSSSEQEPKKKVQTTINKLPSKTEHTLKSPQQNLKMLPPSLRNKNQQVQKGQQPQKVQNSSFKQHQLQQWVTITKQVLQAHRSTLPKQEKQVPFLKQNNLIKFKQIQLDQQRFVPRESEWIEGTVESVANDGKLRLVKVTQLGREYRDFYEVHEYNMVVLEVNRNYLTKQQKDIVLPNQKQNKQQQPHKISQSQIPQQTQQPTPTTEQLSKETQQKNSVQKFICGQVNYYFSDKNYPYDLFMQMHANKHPQKYIPIRFLLNFPKIKKILKDQNKLLQYLVEDEKRNDRNFELDEVRKLVRKKNHPIINEANEDKKLNEQNQQQK